MRPIGYDGNNPTSVAEWLESLELGDYTKSFLINGYTSMELVKKIWEIELINVSRTPSLAPSISAGVFYLEASDLHFLSITLLTSGAEALLLLHAETLLSWSISF